MEDVYNDYGGESNVSAPGMGMGGRDGSDSFFTSEEPIQDIELLNIYCARAHPAANSSIEAHEDAYNSWNPVREWLETHSPNDARAAAEQRGDSLLTALHLACRNGPPIDVINELLTVAPEIAKWPDSFGWLPIHYACACGATKDVIQSLAETYPESKITVDRRGRTPLHFALGTKEVVDSHVIALLSSTGAAGYADESGMLPLHYACAYGASEEALYVLTDAFPDGITTLDNLGRMPLSFALSNAHEPAAPVAVRHLLSLNPEIVGYDDGGTRLPLLVLAEFTSGMDPKKSQDPKTRESIQKCLEYLLKDLSSSKFLSSAAIFTALQALPDWLQEKAVVMPDVQKKLNDKIAERFPSAVNMFDFLCITLSIVFYSWGVDIALDLRYEPNEKTNESVPTEMLFALYLAASWFLIRDGLLQMLSQSTMKSKSTYSWLRNPLKILNLAYVFVTFSWTIQMQLGGGDEYTFRIGTALCIVFPWFKLLIFLRNMFIDFAVFVGGVTYVLKRLSAFIICLFIILITFTQMFNTVFRETPYCAGPQLSHEEVSCQDDANPKHYCNFWRAFLHVITMLLGEVDDTEFKDAADPLGLILFVIFMFLVVILLANVLIAIVTDLYKVIQDQRAAIVFWTNRLDFVAEMDVIANGPWRASLRKKLGLKEEVTVIREMESQFGYNAWKILEGLLRDEMEESVTSLEFLLYLLARFFILVFVIPLWLIFGAISLGWFWPPQVRESIFTSSVRKHASESEKEDELRITQVMKLEQEVQILKDELEQEIRKGKSQVVKMKSAIGDRKAEIVNEIKSVKRIMTMLLEQREQHSGM